MRRVAMISGASRGIGLAIARELKQSGFALSLGIRTPGRFYDPLATEDEVLVYPYDAADPNAAIPWVKATMARFGRIDVLVNNAGISRFVSLDEGSDDDLDEMLAVNVKAPFRVIRAALPHLKASGSGRVINVASLSGKRVMGLNAGYQMSKHAAGALTHPAPRIGWHPGLSPTPVCPALH